MLEIVGHIYCRQLRDNSENPALIFEFLDMLELEYSAWSDRETLIQRCFVYSPTEEAAQADADKINAALDAWKSLGLSIEDEGTTLVKKEDWSEVWKKHFKIMHMGHLVIKPSWLDYHPKGSDVVIEIDPGMSFGTGQHATTSFCLKMLDKLANEGKKGAFLDAGCGSGILSIAAAKLGFSPLEAFDIDPDAVRIAAENLSLNGIGDDAVNLYCGDLAAIDPESKFDLVAANILSSVLVKNREKIVSMLKPTGHLILAGILREEFDRLTESFTELGLKLIHSESEKEWKSGLFVSVRTLGGAHLLF